MLLLITMCMVLIPSWAAAVCECAKPNLRCAFTASGFKYCECKDNFRTTLEGECVCPAEGFTVDANKDCNDINECEAIPPPCNAKQECNNTMGDFECKCKENFETADTGDCICIREGFEVDENYDCKDIDECSLAAPTCSPKHTCANTIGGFRCECKENYNTVGEDCVCPANGYFINNQYECQDIDECEEGNGGCEQECFNQPGSRFCWCSKFGFVHQGDSCLCMDGFVAIGDECTTTDPCMIDNGGCHYFCTQDFTVDPPRPVCSCPDDFFLYANNNKCLRVVNCTINNGGCEAYCVDAKPTRLCTCDEGLEIKDVTECVDFNECKHDNGGCDHNCHNMFGFRICSCREYYDLINETLCFCSEGFIHDEHKDMCIDIDECQTSNGMCEDVCMNTPGSWECHCRDDYIFRQHCDCDSDFTELGEQCYKIQRCEKDPKYCDAVRCHDLPQEWNCSCQCIPDLSLTLNLTASGPEEAKSDETIIRDKQRPILIDALNGSIIFVAVITGLSAFIFIGVMVTYFIIIPFKKKMVDRKSISEEPDEEGILIERRDSNAHPVHRVRFAEDELSTVMSSAESEFPIERSDFSVD